MTSTTPTPTEYWRLIASGGVCPTARSGHSAVVARESLYIFGGCGLPVVEEDVAPETAAGIVEAIPICLGDLHVYDLARQRWSELVCPRGFDQLRPAERTCAAMCASEEEDRLFLSGGAGDDPYDLRCDLLELDLRQCSWRLLYDGESAGEKLSDVSACRRIGHSMVHDTARSRLLVFGGSTGGCHFLSSKEEKGKKNTAS